MDVGSDQIWTMEWIPNTSPKFQISFNVCIAYLCAVHMPDHGLKDLNKEQRSKE